MSTASRGCGIPSGARARWFNAPPVPGSSDEPRGHYDLRASRQLGLPQGLRALRKQEETSPQGGFLKSPRPKCQPESQIAAPASGRSRPFLNIQVCVEPGSGTPLQFFFAHRLTPHPKLHHNRRRPTRWIIPATSRLTSAPISSAAGEACA